MSRPGVRRDEPGPGQESVWDYPRPPRVEPTSEQVVISFGGTVIAQTGASFRVLETSHPPGYYLPWAAFADGVLEPTAGTTYCEFKGTAHYLDLVAGSTRARRAAWFYPEPTAGYEVLRNCVAVYPGSVEQVTVDGETVRAQEGGFYGGWITDRVVGPFKGGPGSMGW